jgi:hypothetical protein
MVSWHNIHRVHVTARTMPPVTQAFALQGRLEIKDLISFFEIKLFNLKHKARNAFWPRTASLFIAFCLFRISEEILAYGTGE